MTPAAGPDDPAVHMRAILLVQRSLKTKLTCTKLQQRMNRMRTPGREGGA